MAILHLPRWALTLHVLRRAAADYCGWHVWLQIGPWLVLGWPVDFGDEVAANADEGDV